MSEVSLRTLSPKRVVSEVLSLLNHGQIEEAIASFAQEFRFKDNGIGLEFSDQQRLTEFFKIARELYPDSSLQIEQLFVSGDHVITQWRVHVIDLNSATVQIHEQTLSRSCNSTFGEF